MRACVHTDGSSDRHIGIVNDRRTTPNKRDLRLVFGEEEEGIGKIRQGAKGYCTRAVYKSCSRNIH